MGRTRINPIKEPRDDLNRRGRRIGDGNKKIKYHLIQKDQETGVVLSTTEWVTIQQIADHLNISRDSVEYMRRKQPKYTSHHTKHLQFLEIVRI